MCSAWCQSKCDFQGTKFGADGQAITAQSCLDECMTSKCSAVMKGVDTGAIEAALNKDAQLKEQATAAGGSTQVIGKTPFSFVELESEVRGERVLTKGKRKRTKTKLPRDHLDADELQAALSALDADTFGEGHARSDEGETETAYDEPMSMDMELPVNLPYDA